MLFGKDHVDRYVATDGAEGYAWRDGTEILILTTRGRKSGALHSTPLIFGRHGDDYLVVGSRGGASAPPAWYLNLVAGPEVQVQVKADRFAAHARTATAAEKPELWKTMTAVWPAYDQYQRRTARVIPVVILTRV
jgi:deazaflavin-dependent oxidoreductase (nitroreductase family)